ncbi:MAG: HlyC/CorC family transporter [Candidatus Aminicenantes bacterium]|nr:HlyC/CorC family transporter [Candidatus Aminicenantes bacterium]
MILTSILLFVVFLIASALFSSSETAFLSCNPYSLDLLEQKGSRRARLIKRLLSRLDQMLAAILIGNTLANIAAASVATLFFLNIMPGDPNRAALLATLTTTLFILVFGEINPKTFAAYFPLKTSKWLVHPLRLFVTLFYPFAKVLTFMPRLLFGTSPEREGGKSSVLSEEEIKLLLTKSIKGMSSLRRRMIGGVLDIGACPVKEIMIPRQELRALEIGTPFPRIIEAILASEYSRLPVYRGRLDNIEGLIHTKDVISYLVDKKDFRINDILRAPLFVPESASIEKVLVQMQERTVHLAFVVDEFGTLEGIVTLEDIIEEIVGEIQDEYDGKAEEWFQTVEKNVYLVKGNASLKELCQRLPLCLPHAGGFTTLAGFLLFQFGRIPREKDNLEFEGNRFTVERMNKRHISLVRISLGPRAAG